MSEIAYPRTLLRKSRHVNSDIDMLLQSLRQSASPGLHLGAGDKKIPGLVNCDLYDPSADLKLDATNLASFDANSVDLIEAHHMIEHLSFSQTEAALKEWFRVLRPGKHVVITCPDLTKIAWKWIFYTLTSRLHKRQEKLDYIIKMLVGPQNHEGMFHKNAFDANRLGKLLSNEGFIVEFHYTPYPRRTTPSLFVIARKPHT